MQFCELLSIEIVQLCRRSWSKLWWPTMSFGLQHTSSTSNLCLLRCAANTTSSSVVFITVMPEHACQDCEAMSALAEHSIPAFLPADPVSDIAFFATQHRILYNNVVSIFWNAFLSTLSHAPTIEPTSLMDSFQQYADTLPQPLHERAAEFVDSIYKTSLPLHERAAEFAESLKLPLVCPACRQERSQNVSG